MRTEIDLNEAEHFLKVNWDPIVWMAHRSSLVPRAFWERSCPLPKTSPLWRGRALAVISSVNFYLVFIWDRNFACWFTVLAPSKIWVMFIWKIVLTLVYSESFVVNLVRKISLWLVEGGKFVELRRHICFQIWYHWVIPIRSSSTFPFDISLNLD